jgi:hypothetical protein
VREAANSEACDLRNDSLVGQQIAIHNTSAMVVDNFALHHSGQRAFSSLSRKGHRGAFFKLRHPRHQQTGAKVSLIIRVAGLIAKSLIIRAVGLAARVIANEGGK